MSEQQEKRNELRLGSPAAVIVELEAADPASGAPARRLLCRLLDFSASGLRIRIDRSLDQGTIFPLGVRLPGQQRMLWLVGEVRWACAAEGAWTVGFTLFEADHSDIADWKRCVADALR